MFTNEYKMKQNISVKKNEKYIVIVTHDEPHLTSYYDTYIKITISFMNIRYLLYADMSMKNLFSKICFCNLLFNTEK